ncbi:MAG: M23 family metallopeptidase [Clostridium sp.]|nr:M23 family metallopeptidase [Clostridium sp.]
MGNANIIHNGCTTRRAARDIMGNMEDVLFLDDIVLKTRYPRQRTQSMHRRMKKPKRQRYNSQYSYRPFRRIRVQIIVCIFILSFIGIMGSIDSPVTNYLWSNIKNTISYDITHEDIMSVLGSLLPEKKINDEKINDLYDECAGKTFDDDTIHTVKPKGGFTDQDGAGIVEDIPSGGMVGGIDYYTESEPRVGKSEGEDFIIPVGGIIGLQYGDKVHTSSGELEFHKGINIKTSEGTPIRALGRGEVIDKCENEIYGKFITLKHDSGVLSLYAQCSLVMADRGQMVNGGEIIAKVGGSGTPEGTHLHLEVWRNGQTVDPLELIKVSP